MKPKVEPKLPALLLLTLSVLLTGCVGASLPLQPQSVAPPRIPSLPNEARASKVPMPSMCSPGCSQGLTTLRESWLPMPTDSALPALPASPSQTDYSLPLGKKITSQPARQ